MAEENMAPPTGEMETPRLGRGILIALGATLVLAAVYAGLIIATESSWAILMVAIGLVIGILMARGAGGGTQTAGIIAAILTLVGIVLAVMAANVGLVAKILSVSVSEVIEELDHFEALKLFFEENALRYVYGAGGVVLAFVMGAGLGGKRFGK